MAGEIDGIALGAVALGGAFIWSGIKGKSILQVIQNTVQGKSSADAATANPISAPTTQSPDTGTGSAGTGADVSVPSGGGALSGKNAAIAIHGAGFSGEALVIALAVAKAESNWRPTAHNSTPPDDSYGLFQINMLGSMGPARRMQYHLASNEALFDPATNARVAFSMSGGGSNWSPWTTYTRGNYQGNMAVARAAARAAGLIGG